MISTTLQLQVKSTLPHAAWSLRLLTRMSLSHRLGGKHEGAILEEALVVPFRCAIHFVPLKSFLTRCELDTDSRSDGRVLRARDASLCFLSKLDSKDRQIVGQILAAV